MLVLLFIIQDEKSYFSISLWLSTLIWESMKNIMYLMHEIEAIGKLVGNMKVEDVWDVKRERRCVNLYFVYYGSNTMCEFIVCLC